MCTRINLNSAALSTSYFVASERSNKYLEYSRIIGSKSHDAITTELAEIEPNFRKELFGDGE